MDSNTLLIQLTPSYRSTAESMGHDFDSMDVEANNNAILFQQGFEMETIEVQAGEEFEIPLGLESAIISCEEINYTVTAKNFDGKEEVLFEYEDTIDLGPGKYRLLPDGKKIERLSIIQEDSGDFEED